MIFSRRMRFREKSIGAKVVGNKILCKIHSYKSNLSLFISLNIHNPDIFVFLSCLRYHDILTQITLHLLKMKIDEGADYNPYSQPGCHYSSSSKQGRNIACCKSYGKLKIPIRNDGLNIPDTFCSLWGV